MWSVVYGFSMQAKDSLEVALSEVRDARIRAEANEKKYVEWKQRRNTSDNYALLAECKSLSPDKEMVKIIFQRNRNLEERND